MVPRKVDDSDDTFITINATRAGKRAIYAGGGIAGAFIGIPVALAILAIYTMGVFRMLSLIFPPDSVGDNVLAGLFTLLGLVATVIFCVVVAIMVFKED